MDMHLINSNDIDNKFKDFLFIGVTACLNFINPFIVHIFFRNCIGVFLEPTVLYQSN